MKRKLFFKLLGVICLLLCFSALCACGNSGDGGNEESNDTTAPVKITYTVTVNDPFGAPTSEPAVRILKNGEQVSFLFLTDGTASVELEAGEYTAELVFAGDSYYYDKASCVLTADAPAITVILAASVSSSETIFAYAEELGDHAPNTAYFVGEGATYVTVEAGKRTYFLFHPTRAGVFKIDTSLGADGAVGYFGGTFNVLAENQGKTDGTGVLIEVRAAMIGNTYVIGVDAEAADAILTVTRIGDPEPTIDEIPWTPYTEENLREFYAESANYTYKSFQYFDVTDETLSAVFNKEDGYYHLNSADGPLLYIALGVDSPYLSSFKTICDNQRMGIYLYDKDGKFLSKESYNELFEQYGYATVPLTEKLAYATRAFGEVREWWDFSTQNHIFPDNSPYVVEENAWLFCCGYYTDEGKTEVGSADAPVAISTETVQIRLAGGDAVHFATAETAGKLITVKGVDAASCKVLYNGQTYTAANGEITFALVADVASFALVTDAGEVLDFVTVSLGTAK